MRSAGAADLALRVLAVSTLTEWDFQPREHCCSTKRSDGSTGHVEGEWIVYLLARVFLKGWDSADEGWTGRTLPLLRA